MIAITGATGNTGSIVAEKLLALGEKIRVIGRDATRLKRFVQKGAEPVITDVTGSDALTRAFTGVDAVYVMIPPNISSPDPRGYQEKVTDALASALKQAGVKHAVVLSSIGADKPDKTGPVVGLHNLEEKLKALPQLNAIFLRAGYFMENLLPQVNVVRNFGVVGGPLRPDLRVGMIATSDIGAVAAELLHKRDFTGKQTRELLGQRDVDYKEVATVIGRAIGKPSLTYTQMPPQQLKPAFTQMGMSPAMADLLLEMAAALNSGHMVALEKRSGQNTTPTSLETFIAEKFVPAFKQKKAVA